MPQSNLFYKKGFRIMKCNSCASKLKANDMFCKSYGTKIDDINESSHKPKQKKSKSVIFAKSNFWFWPGVTNPRRYSLCVIAGLPHNRFPTRDCGFKSLTGQARNDEKYAICPLPFRPIEININVDALRFLE